MQLNNEYVLTKAYLKAGEKLGVELDDLSKVIGKDLMSSLQEIELNSEPKELALVFIECYRSLFTLFGNDSNSMQHWMRTMNHGIKGVPKEQIKTKAGLYRILHYLDEILKNSKH